MTGRNLYFWCVGSLLVLATTARIYFMCKIFLLKREIWRQNQKRLER